MNNNLKTFKVAGHRPFENDCTSVNILKAKNAEEAKTSMINFYGFRGDDNNQMKKTPNVIIDIVEEI